MLHGKKKRSLISNAVSRIHFTLYENILDETTKGTQVIELFLQKKNKLQSSTVKLTHCCNTGVQLGSFSTK